MKQHFIEGAVYGILTAFTGYMIVQYLGFTPQTLSTLLYLYVISGIIINMKAEIQMLSIPVLKRLVLVAEGKEIKMKKLLTGEEYKVKGEVEKL